MPAKSSLRDLRDPFAIFAVKGFFYGAGTLRSE
jgi:hypothetical protein